MFLIFGVGWIDQHSELAVSVCLVSPTATEDGEAEIFSAGGVVAERDVPCSKGLGPHRHSDRDS